MFKNKWNYTFGGFSKNVFKVPFNFNYIIHNQDKRNENSQTTTIGTNTMTIKTNQLKETKMLEMKTTYQSKNWNKRLKEYCKENKRKKAIITENMIKYYLGDDFQKWLPEILTHVFNKPDSFNLVKKEIIEAWEQSQEASQ